MTTAYYVPVTIDQGKNVMLLDSGCTQSAFPLKEFQKLSAQSCTKLQPVLGQGILADGTEIQLQGLSYIQFQLGTQKISHQFVIADIDNAILLGLDFFEHHQCLLDFQNAQLKIRDSAVRCCDSQGNLLKVNVQVRQDTVLPPRTEKFSMARLSTKWVQGTACIESADRVPGVLVATTVQDPDEQQVHLRLMNYTDREIRIPAGKIVATCMAANLTRPAPTESASRCQLPEHLKTLVEESCQGFSLEEKQKVQALITEHQSAFSSSQYDLGKTNVIKHGIPLVPGAKPLKQRPYRHGTAQEAEIEKQVKELQGQGLIREGHGAWSSPVVLVQKKDGSWRFCVDYRKLNEITHKDAYPLPRIDDTLDALGGSRLFSTLDLTSGYWQVEMEDDAKEKAAFATRSGLWEWQVLPFGLTSAPSTFERLMETVLRGLHWKTLLIYLDDIIVFSKDLDSHLERLKEVFVRLQEAGLKLKPAKCRLFADRVHYLGHVVSASGVETEESKVTAVKEWPVPRHKKDVRAFLGTCGYYRRFIHNYSDISRPLSQLSSKHARFEWTEKCKLAFQELKERLTSAPILAYPNHSLPFLLDTDASGVGTGAVLSQIQDGHERVIAYFSKMYTKEQRNYCVTRQELLAIINVVKHFRPLLFGREFTIRTDHASLPWLLRMPNPAGQLARWLEILTEYNFQLLHRKGLKHCNADGLSRQVCHDCQQCQRMFPDQKSMMRQLQVDSQPLDCSTGACATQGKIDVVDIALAQKVDEQIREVYQAVKEQATISGRELGWHAQKLLRLWEHLRLTEEGVLQVNLPQRSSRTWRTVCPMSMRAEVIQATHAEAHLGFNKTLAVVRQRWYWPGMTSQVRQWIQACLPCQKSKPASHKSHNTRNKLWAGRPWQIIAVDLCGPLPETTRGNTEILVLADHFTRWYDAIPIPDGQASTVARVLDERIFSYFGIPEIIHTDQGSQFQSELLAECCKLWNCDKTQSAPYHPQGNSVVERLNRTMGNSLRAMLAESEHLEWDQLVPQIMRAVRATPHSSTGETPNYLMLGRETRLPHDLLLNYPTGVDCSEKVRSSSAE